ncbi:MAG: hypothetical protein ACOX5G_07630 [Kiritimatiellia bacterium]|jgi:hypothetical protein
MPNDPPKETRIPKRAAIGFDDSDAPRPVCSMASRSGGAPLFGDADPAHPAVSARLRSGARCAAACGGAALFAVRLDLPAAARRGRHAREAVEALLDTRLAFPVEEARYVLLREPDGASATAFVMRRPDVARRLEALGHAGCDPEFLVPEPLALWRRRLADPTDSTDGLHVLVHACAGSWTLVVGEGAHLLASLSIAPGDGAIARRTLQVLAPGTPPSAVRWFLCGPEARPGPDWERFRETAGLPDATSPAVPPQPASYLAGALALLALENGADFSLRPAETPCPDVEKREKRRAAFVRIALVAAAIPLFAGSIAASRAGAALADKAERQLRDEASRLAGQPLHLRGPALLQAARRMFDERLDPDVEAWIGRPGAAVIRDTLQIAALRDISIHLLRFEDGRLTLSGTAATAADIDALELALRDAGFPAAFVRTASEDAIAFSGTAVEVSP